LQKARNSHAIRNHYGRVLASAIIAVFGSSFLFSLYANKSDGAEPLAGLFHWLLVVGFFAAPIAYFAHSYILIWDVVLDRYGATIALLRSRLAARAATVRSAVEKR